MNTFLLSNYMVKEKGNNGSKNEISSNEILTSHFMRLIKTEFETNNLIIQCKIL